MSDALTLSDVLGGRNAVEWPEGVAVVRGIAARLLADAAQANLVPDLHQIRISRSGQIDIIAGTITDEPVRRLGQLLQATLGSSEPPVQLRLIVSRATAPIPGFASIREYDEALAYFERPNREAVLRAMYARTAAAVKLSSSGAGPTLDTLAPLPTVDAPRAAQPHASVKFDRRLLRLVAIGVVVVLVCVTAVQYVRVRLAQGENDVPAIALYVSDAVGAAVVTGMSAVTERVGLGRLVSAAAAAGEPPIPGPAPPVKAARTRVANSVPVNPPMPFAAFDLQLGPTSEPVAPSDLASFAKPGSQQSSKFGVEPAAGEGGAQYQPPVTYSSESDGVSSPVGVRPQLPRVLPSDLNRNDLGRIELVVLPDGTVESVKLLGAHASIYESMMLSAAKAWQFQPAMKGEVPVRYRKTIWIAPQ